MILIYEKQLGIIMMMAALFVERKIEKITRAEIAEYEKRDPGFTSIVDNMVEIGMLEEDHTGINLNENFRLDIKGDQVSPLDLYKEVSDAARQYDMSIN